MAALILGLACAALLSADATAAQVRRCDQLAIHARHVGAALGTAGGYLSFRNTSASACRLSGWPAVVGITATGKAIPAVRRRTTMFGPNVKSVPVIVLQPGRRAEAVFAVGDNPGPGQRICDVYRSLHVTAPGTTRIAIVSTWFASLDAWLSACTPISVTMVVPGADLRGG